MDIIKKSKKYLTSLTKMCDTIGPAVDVFIRLYLGKIYFNEGYRMLNHIDGTISEFSGKNLIPGLSADLTVHLLIGLQLLFPFLLIIGLGARLPAVVLAALTGLLIFADWSTFNTSAGSAEFSQYMLQVFMLGVIIAHGHGKFSVDYRVSLKDSDYRY